MKRAKATAELGHGIDRIVRNIETGRFERSLSALTGVDQSEPSTTEVTAPPTNPPGQ